MSRYVTEWPIATTDLCRIRYIFTISGLNLTQTKDTVVPETVIVDSYIHLPASQFAWNTIFLPSVVAVAPPGAVKLNGLPVTANGAELLVNGPLTEEAVA